MGLWGFWRRKQVKIVRETTEQKEEGFSFDREHHKPVIRASICTGEQVAGFKDRRTGRFTEIMLVRNHEDIEKFIKEYGILREEITREW